MTKTYGLVAIIVLTVVAIILVGVISVRAQIFDRTDNTDPVIVEKAVPLTDAIHHHLVMGLKGGTEGVLRLSLDAYDVNELLYALSDKVNSGILDVKSIYIENIDGVYRLCIPVTVMGIDSLISGELDIQQVGDTFFAYVKGLRVGRVDMDSALASLIGVEKRLVDALCSAGLNAYVVGDTLTVQLSKADLGNIISTALADNPSGGLVDALYSLAVMGGAMEIDIASPTEISIAVDMTRFDGHRDTALDGLNVYTEALLRDGVVDKDGIGLVSKYYVNGYDRLTDEEKTDLASRLASKNTPDELMAHGGCVKREKISLLSLLLTQLELNTDYLLPGFKIADGDISAMLSDLPLVGSVWQYSSYRDHSCAFVAVQSLYCVLSDDVIEMYIDLNVNGYLLTLRAKFITGESPVTAIGGSLDSAYLGDVMLDEFETDRLFDFLCAKLQQDWIYTDSETKTLTLDFTSTFEESNLLLAIIRGSKNIVTVCREGLLGGYAQITFTLF